MREQIATGCMREQIVIKDWERADGLDSLLSTDRERVAEKKRRLQVKETWLERKKRPKQISVISKEKT